MEIRLASIEDAAAIRAIYAPYIENTAISFEYEVPSLAEMEKRIATTLENYPYLVAVENDRIVGYAYASSFHTRAAYQHSAELSIYIDREHRQQGIGNQLYTKLIELLKKQNIYTVHACIAYADEKDDHLTNDSVAFHTKMGFELVGKHSRCGYKFGKWYSIVWMDLEIEADKEMPGKFVPFGELEKK